MADAKPLADVPLAELTMFVRFFDPKKLSGLIKAAQQQAWAEYSEGPLVDRFKQVGFPNRLGFAKRSFRYQQRYTHSDPNVPHAKKSGSPHFVYTGRGRDQVLKRGAKTTRNESYVSTRKSIFFNALNALGSQRGVLTETQIVERKEVTRPAHVRRSKNGKLVSVRAYRQMTGRPVYKSTPAQKTYAEEWAFRQEEVNAVKKRADELLEQAIRVKGFTRRGALKKKFRDEFYREQEEV